MARHQNDLGIRLFLVKAAQDVIAVAIAVGAQLDITEHQRPDLTVKQLERLLG